MYLSEHDVRGIASNTRIKLADDEVKELTADLNTIIESLKPITEYDLTGVKPTYHPIAGLSNVMREDRIAPGLSHDVALAIAPAIEDGQYRIPPILSEGSGK